MPGWFVPVIAVLIVVALGFLIALWTTRRRKYALGLGITAALIALVWLVASLIETDQRRLERSLHAMADGVKAKNIEQIFTHISGDFRLGAIDKAAFRTYAERHIRNGDVTHVEIWDIQRAEVSREKKTATIAFMVKPLGPATIGTFYRCKAVFVLENDDRWRLKSFELFNPAVETTTPLEIPGLR